MSDRDRLIKLLLQSDPIKERDLDDDWGDGELEEIADHLLANGVIVQKQGEWKETKEPLGYQDIDCVECSACHESWILDEDFDFEFCKEVWHYCPNCGAKIKECDNDAR